MKSVTPASACRVTFVEPHIHTDPGVLLARGGWTLQHPLRGLLPLAAVAYVLVCRTGTVGVHTLMNVLPGVGCIVAAAGLGKCGGGGGCNCSCWIHVVAGAAPMS